MLSGTLAIIGLDFWDKFGSNSVAIPPPVGALRGLDQGASKLLMCLIFSLSTDNYSLIKYPLTTEAAMKKIEDHNTLVFIVETNSNKFQIKTAVKKVKLGIWCDIYVSSLQLFVRASEPYYSWTPLPRRGFSLLICWIGEGIWKWDGAWRLEACNRGWLMGL